MILKTTEASKYLGVSINTLMEFCETEYQLNPNKDSLIKKLEELRNKYTKGE